MNAPKPTESLAGQICPACEQGKLALVQVDHTEAVAEDNPLLVRGIWVERCEHCGETVFPGETVRFIESVVAEQAEQLVPRELERIREDLGIEIQDEMSKMLGLGTKTYHNWESGKQFPTRSMSYYIRVLAEFPQAFDWLRRRAWRNQNRLNTQRADFDAQVVFPDLPRTIFVVDRAAATPKSPSPACRNPALAFTRVAFHVK